MNELYNLNSQTTEKRVLKDDDYKCQRFHNKICSWCGGEIWYLREGFYIRFYCDNLDCNYEDRFVDIRDYK